MAIGNIVMIALGLLAMVLGWFMFASVKFRAWTMSYGRGAMWTKLLGERRADWATRFIFGPVCLIFGALMVLVSAFGGPIGS
ncbi:hypothetical protein [Asticcacaulis sp. 201]|uniref:hypothetical protein n=1 Tax=Asticcacaulis sp. 201 TaxID=3028787 RepID=UPI002916CDE4|nr:hypothetical protein [Asticcacaulis sp. 201]MDV6330227.1 hypothetical protein [Asticcacaulis sp. 201]